MDTAQLAAVALSHTNPHLATLKEDNMYHIGFSTRDDLRHLFGDVQVVVTGGSPTRMQHFAEMVLLELDLPLPFGSQLHDICSTDRYSMYKAGPVLCVSHGMGQPSCAIMLNELVKLLAHAGHECGNMTFIRLGTSGGLGVTPGSVVLSTQVYDGLLRASHESFILGQRVERDTKLDEALSDAIAQAAPSEINIVRGATMSTSDFFEGQGRLDGAICSFGEEDKMRFLQQAAGVGVVNIEMEALVFSSFCHTIGVPAAVVCATLVDRLQGDQLSEDSTMIKSFSLNAQRVLLAYLKARFGK